MNWDYVRGKKKTKGKLKKTNKKETNKKKNIKKKCASGNIDHKLGMSHYIP
jgi:hypothetical protein